VQPVGYAFETEQPAPGNSVGFNNWQMSFLREIMREVGAADEAGFPQALRLTGFAPSDQSAPMEKFLSNGNWHVTEQEARFIADRLRAGIAEGVPQEVVSFFDDAPNDVVVWVKEFADFNELAADRGGYRVR
jgi:hypothetical protein